jgi:peptidyl-prolyl cis-trans isomerase A (cyclophilin A)
MRAPLLPACCVLLLLASSSLAAPKEAPARASPEARPVTVILQTDKGEIELVLDAARAPLTVKNFLHYVDAGLFSGGVFHRTVTPGNQPDKAVKIEVIQGGIAPGKTAAQLAPIALERTKDTGLKHLDGTVSMARDTPDSAQSDFFICVGDQPALDFGGQRNPDGQGFAAFGRVVRGMDVVRAIQKAPAEGQRLTPLIQILRATRKG